MTVSPAPRFLAGFPLGIIGSPAPVLPGFGMDVSTPIADSGKPDQVWHRERARRLLAAHPDVQELVGRNPRTAIWCVVFIALQVGLAAAVASQPPWAVVLAAYVVGAWANINLFMLAHECNHGLVLAGATANRWLFTFTTLPMFLSAHHAWWIEHHVHHSDMGADKDFIRRRRAFFLLTRRATPLVVPFALFMLITQPLRSALGLLVWLAGVGRGRAEPGSLALSLLGDRHLVSGYRRYRMPGWAVVYAASSLAFTGAMASAFGWGAIAYLLLSQLFMTGFLHPLLFGMILSNSHFHGSAAYQPTSSYYGWLNRLTFNFGYHTEHHDHAGIPWNRLPELRRRAPELYDDLYETRSYVGLALAFVLGGRHRFAERFGAA